MTRRGTPTAQSKASEDPAENAEPHRTNRIAIGAGIAGFLIMGLFWAAIFAGKFNSRNPDLLRDQTWATNAEQICKPAATAINKLPNATTTKSAAQRAELLDEGTTMLTPMVSRLRQLERPTHVLDQKIVDGWLQDWEIYLGDRKAYAQELRKDPAAKPLLTKTHGGWDTDAIDAMARANNLDSCVSPPDM